MSTRTTMEKHQFGGKWTDEKLEVVGKYLKAYTTIMSKRDFRVGYIDAFAGTGYRNHKQGNSSLQPPIFPELLEQEAQDFLDGSAKLALQTEPPFDGYIFIEKNARRSQQLKQIKEEFPGRASLIQVRRGDANKEVQRICTVDWRNRRAVLFLDPYGMQVEWTTIEAVAKTGAIDLWILFPFSINRLLKRSGEISRVLRDRLDAFFGTEEWYERFYPTNKRTNLFGISQEEIRKVRLEAIGEYFVERLRTLFCGVAHPPGVLRNSSGTPLFLLCYAINNRRGSRPGLRIANDLLKDLK